MTSPTTTPAAPPERLDLEAVSRELARPKVAPADSFVLHAPLELLARLRLLDRVPAAARADAAVGIRALRDDYRAAGAGLADVPAGAGAPPRPDDLDAAAARLVVAIGAGELDDADRAAWALGSVATAGDLRRLLAAPLAPLLAAAGHASILLDLLPRVDARVASPTLLRGPARELARHPDWKLSWFDGSGGTGDAVRTDAVVDAMVSVPHLGVPGSTFIFPLMHQAEASGLAAAHAGACLPDGDVTAADLRVAAVALARVAAWSMLQEPPDHAPYGWTHCLTMPQAVLAAAVGSSTDRRAALAVAATHVVGFRAALGTTTLGRAHALPDPVAGSFVDAIHAGRDEAATWVLHAPDTAIGDVADELASRAARHHDAHLAKYTMAAFDAAAADPGEERLHLAAAASLSAWWAAFDRVANAPT